MKKSPTENLTRILDQDSDQNLELDQKLDKESRQDFEKYGTFFRIKELEGKIFQHSCYSHRHVKGVNKMMFATKLMIMFDMISTRISFILE